MANSRACSQRVIPGRNSAVPPASSAAVSRRMKGTRQRDTAAELEVRRALHACGLRYVLNKRVASNSRRNVDIVFPSARVALFVDGCFWHGCPIHGTLPAVTNSEFWKMKIQANKRRDRLASAELKVEGWTVIRVWEHESPTAIAQRVSEAVRSKSLSRSSP